MVKGRKLETLQLSALVRTSSELNSVCDIYAEKGDTAAEPSRENLCELFNTSLFAEESNESAKLKSSMDDESVQ